MSDKKLDKWLAENITNSQPIFVKQVTDVDKDIKEITIGLVKEYPRYTSDMNEAVKLLEISSMTLPGSYAFYDYCTILDMDDNVLSRAKIDQPALAICLAFYKLKTGEEWDSNEQ